MVFTQISVSETRARREVERLVGVLQDANDQLRKYATQVEELAITKERNRMAREIHDGLGHYMTTIFMEIQAARAVMEKDPLRSKELLEKAQGQAQDALKEIRQSVSALRAPIDVSLPADEMVSKLLENCKTLGMETEFHQTGARQDLPPQVQLTLYRAVQESVSNICKHSKATQVWVSIDYNAEGWIRLMIQDNGIGASELDGGFGLVGLRERVALLNGELNIETGQNEGFRLEVRLPL
jgi:signal transduction histidine kinase